MDVVGLGALNYDRLYAVDKCTTSKKFAKPGEEADIINAKGCPGGSAANTIVGLARLGLSTGFIGIVGDDAEGDVIMDEFAVEGVDVSRIRREVGCSGAALVFVDAQGERALYISPGVNDALYIDKGDLEYANNAQFVHMDSFVSAEQLEMQKKFMKETRAAVSFAPGMMCFKFKFDVLKPIIESCHIVFLNEGEIHSLTSVGYKKGGEILLNVGAEMVVVTLGKKGCYIANEDIYIAASGACAVDTTGAGDAFAAGFLYGLSKGERMRRCGELGTAVASMCIGKYGAREGLPYKRDLEEFR
ncbi:MAG: carbohydrate kinase family protein [Methanosarcinales archaeon Met12]|nr:MAG: carbohydrate kinase family protein [Methanosarcinales archaeon Met12]